MTPIPIETKRGKCELCKTNGLLSAHDKDVDIDIRADCAEHLVFAEAVLEKAGLVDCTSRS
jgi:hypothetical protein